MPFIDRNNAKQLLETIRKDKKIIVFTNGCFDIIHRGHIEYLKQARKLGDYLIVGLNSDDSVRRLKGNARPYNSEIDRAEVLNNLRSVDLVIIFKEDTPLNLINELKPDILVKGGDYNIETIVGAKETISWGGKVEIIKFLEGYGTSKLIEKIINN